MNFDIIKLRARDMVLLTILVLAMALPGLANLPVIDRDEARYAQASVQMMETGDYINIRFQDRARNKKPAGAYWLQSLSVKTFSDVKKREIWAHRIPSVLAAIIAVLATYWGGARMLGRQSAFIGAALLATSMIFVFEAHIAKTDALLCAFAALTLAALGHLRNGGGRKSALLFWIALGCGVMIKGPMLLLVILLCITTLVLWERTGTWLKPLRFWLGPLLFFAIILPWSVLIWKETGGAFFSDAIGGDLTPKLKGGHERHGGLPGYYSLTTWLAFWPACLFLLPGLGFAIRAARGDTAVAKAARLLLCWSLPFFIMLEFIPTKLPHYPLPIYPAWALLSGAAISALSQVNTFPALRRIGASIFAVFSLALVAALLGAQSYYGVFPTWTFGIMGVAILLCFFAAIKLWNGKSMPAFYASLAAAFIVSLSTYQFTLPSLQPLLLSKRVKFALQQSGIVFPYGNRTIFSPRFTEPSLVYRLGTNIILGQPEKHLNTLDLKVGDVIILDRARDDTEDYEKRLKNKLADNDTCLTSLHIVEGMNYAKGDDVKLDILQINACPRKAQDGPIMPREAPATKPDP